MTMTYILNNWARLVKGLFKGTFHHLIGIQHRALETKKRLLSSAVSFYSYKISKSGIQTKLLILVVKKRIGAPENGAGLRLREVDVNEFLKPKLEYAAR